MPSSGEQLYSRSISVRLIDQRDRHQVRRARQGAEAMLERAVGADLTDDRFRPFERADPDVAMVVAEVLGGERDDETLVVGFAVAEAGGGRLQVDVMTDGKFLLEPMSDGGDHDPTRSLADGSHVRGHDRYLAPAAALGRELVEAAVDGFARQVPRSWPGLQLEVWGRPVQPWHEAMGAGLGLEVQRSLHQMRCPLPLPEASFHPVPTRDLDPVLDPPRLLQVNNRAFAFHPDQGDQRLEDLESAFTKDGFDPASVRVVDAPVGDPRAADHPMAGFCWTKIHPEIPGRPLLGEIYVIAVDPDFHGEGLGTGLTVAGLEWLHRQGPAVGMLYVESDNKPAVATYRKLGFAEHSTYSAWRRPKPVGTEGEATDVR